MILSIALRRFSPICASHSRNSQFVFFRFNSSWSRKFNRGNFPKWIKRVIVPCALTTSTAGIFYLIQKQSFNVPIRTMHCATKSEPPVSRRDQLNFFADVVEKVLPAVVHVEVVSEGSVPVYGSASHRMSVISQSGGSGIIISQDGTILTNAHVVQSGDYSNTTVRIKLHDGRSFEGRVQMIDRQADLATVKIEGVSSLPVLEFADSSSARPGEFVVAVGSPLFLSNTVTTGVISNVKRKLNEMGLIDSPIEYIQTDAAINIGNSGGPLVNLDGQVVGINTLKVAELDGVSFAIPSNYVQDFVNRVHELEKSSMKSKDPKWWSFFKSKHRHIGISYFVLTDDVAAELKSRHGIIFDLPDSGAMVHSVTVGSMAHRSGIEPGDIITHVNNKAIKDGTEITSALDSSDQVNFQIWRGGQRLSLNMTFD